MSSGPDGRVRVDTVLLKVASRCNLDCSYCYVYRHGDEGWRRQPKRMSADTIAACVQSLAELYQDQGAPFAVVLHGGEPLLLGLEGLTLLLRGLEARLPAACTRSIQTNGLLIDDALLDLCASTGTTISVSLDGPPEVHNRARVDHGGRPSHAGVVANLQRLREHPAASWMYTGTLSVVHADTDPGELYRYLRQLQVPSMDFLLPDGNHDAPPLHLSPGLVSPYGRWLAQLFEIHALDPHPVPIRIVDDFVRALVGGRGTKEGMGAEDFAVFVIETDGSVAKNDTLKSTHPGADRFSTTWSVYTDKLSTIAQSEEFGQYLLLQRPTSSECQSCPYLSVCGGGMPLSRWSGARGLDNPSVYCADYKHLIDHIRSRLLAYT